MCIRDSPSSISHYEFFLVRPPYVRQSWSDDAQLLRAIPEPNPCLTNWRDSPQFFNPSYEIVTLESSEWDFLLTCEGNQTAQRTVSALLQEVDSDLASVRSLQRQQLLLLTPSF